MSVEQNIPTDANPVDAADGRNAGERFGDLLSRFVSLSRHDIYEVLEEQAGTHKKFGQIALQLGLCEPIHIWQAWSAQLLDRTPRVNLDEFGIDAQATAEVPGWLSVALGVVPIRSMDDRLVIAASDATLARATEVLTAQSTKPLTFVVADRDQVEAAIARYYAHVPARGNLQSATSDCPAKRCGQTCRGEDCPVRKKLAERKLAMIGA